MTSFANGETNFMLSRVKRKQKQKQKNRLSLDIKHEETILSRVTISVKIYQAENEKIENRKSKRINNDNDNNM